MDIIVALTIGILFASSVYLLLHKNLFKLILGVIIFGYASIYFLFIVCGVTENHPPLLANGGNGEQQDIAQMADPLPQALTMTSIVISIGVQLFVIVLIQKVYALKGERALEPNNSSKNQPSQTA